MSPPVKVPSATCHVCAREDVRLVRDLVTGVRGVLGRHYSRGGVRRLCLGSGQSPRPSIAEVKEGLRA